MCFFCKGSFKDSFTNHVVNLKNCIIIIKNVPCVECTQCGNTFYSDEVAEQLEKILKPINAGMTEITVINYADRVA